MPSARPLRLKYNASICRWTNKNQPATKQASPATISGTGLIYWEAYSSCPLSSVLLQAWESTLDPGVAEERGLVASPGSTGAAVITLEQPGAAPGGPVRTATA